MLDKFKKHHEIVEKVISGESGCVSEADCSQWKATISKSIVEETISPDNIFNMDETGLFFKCLPNKTLTFKNDKCFGGKHSKERVTVVVCANMLMYCKLMYCRKLRNVGSSYNWQARSTMMFRSMNF